MSCTSPLLAVCLGNNPGDPTKKKIKILPRRADLNLKMAREKYGSDLLLLPCGHCIGCANDYAKMWSDRIVLEASLYEKNCFLTLTYENAPPLPIKEDVQEFIKKVRDSTSNKIRYFAVAERGSRTGRSHYHIILFNYDFDDKKKLKESGSNILYTSEKLSKIWNKGICSIGEVTPASASYCAHYSLKKKVSGMSDGEFVLMSTRPGIGSQYYDLHKNEIFTSDSIYYDGHKLSIPRYFRKLAERDGGVKDYDRFLIKIQRGKQLIGVRGTRSVAVEEESLSIDERLNHYQQRRRNTI